MKHTSVKISIIKALLACAVITFMTIEANSFYVDGGFGARSVSMGQAFTAVEGDINSILLNPSSLASIEYPEISAFYGRMHMGLEDDSKIGQSHFLFAAPLPRYLTGVVGFAWQETGLSGAYKESSFALSYSTEVRKGILVGGNLKILRVSYERDVYTEADPLFSGGYLKSALSVDLGGIYRIDEKYNFGLSLRNVNSPDLSLGTGGDVPAQIRLGLSYSGTKNLVDFDFSRYGGDYDFSLGADHRLNSRFSMRLGLLAGNDSRRDLNLGFGGRFNNFLVDYAFTLPVGGISSTAGSHRISFSMRFGASYEEAVAVGAADISGIREQLSRALSSMSEARRRAEKQEKQIAALESKLKEQGEIMRNMPPGAPAPSSASGDLEDRLSALRKDLSKSREELASFKRKVAELEKKFSKKEARPRPASVPGPKAAPAPKTYTVKKGDTLKSVAQKIYGDSSKWVEIYKVNSADIGRGGQIKPGQVLTLP